MSDDPRPVRIDGDVVSRPSSPASATVHAHLRHLRAQGVTEVPEPLGIDGDTETLSYLPGESGGDGWRHQHTDRGVTSAARLLRRVHDAGGVAGDDLVWCHGDPGPWNFVWRDRVAVGLLDWDFLHRGPRTEDVAYALRWFAPLRADEHALDWHHFPEVPDRRHRVRVFLEAYGDLPDFDVTEAVAAAMTATNDRMLALAAEGVEPQRTWVDEGAAEEELAEIAWVREHRDLWS